MSQKIIREITPLRESDFFSLSSRKKTDFDFPIHFHEEYELNLILYAEGARRIVGNDIATIGDMELVFVGPNLYHGWFTHECKSEMIHEITIQFNNEVLNENFLNKNQSSRLKKLCEDAQKGVLFSPECISAIKDSILLLKETKGFTSVLSFMQIFHELSLSSYRTLCNDGFQEEMPSANCRRIKLVFDFMNKNFSSEVSLEELAKLVNMHEASLSRFIKKRTGKKFIDCLNEIRIGQASRMLIDTTQSVSEIACACGFNNISYFNRVFKKQKKSTPKEFRNDFVGIKVYV